MHTFRRTGCVCMHMHAMMCVYLLVYTPCVHMDVGRCVPIGGPAMYACVCEEVCVFMHPVAQAVYAPALRRPVRLLVYKLCVHTRVRRCVFLVCHIPCA